MREATLRFLTEENGLGGDDGRTGDRDRDQQPFDHRWNEMTNLGALRASELPDTVRNQLQNTSAFDQKIYDTVREEFRLERFPDLVDGLSSKTF